MAERVTSETLHTERSIRTFTGRYVDVFDPKEDMIDIVDIAHALSMQPRWGGHCQKFYSVAQHCLLVTQLTKDKTKLRSILLDSLMHDASEAYLMDIPRPIKRSISEYHPIEKRLMEVIYKKFNIELPHHEFTKYSDESALILEWDRVVLGCNMPAMAQQTAKTIFLHYFRVLTDGTFYDDGVFNTKIY